MIFPQSLTKRHRKVPKTNISRPPFTFISEWKGYNMIFYLSGIVMSVKTICNRQVIIAESNASIQEIAKLMREYHVGNVVIVEEQQGLRFPIGILTDRDIIIELVAKGADLTSVTAGDVMSTEIFNANEEDDVIDTIKQMRSKGIRRMPVVDKQGALVGIVALDDLLDLLAEQLKDLADLIGKEQNREQRTRS